MPGISRRRFLRDASLGAAAVGAFAVVGPQALGAATASASPVGPGPAYRQRKPVRLGGDRDQRHGPCRGRQVRHDLAVLRDQEDHFPEPRPG